MKRAVMQILRLMVTVIVVSTMAVMIFSLRSELAAAKACLQQCLLDPGVMATIADRTSIRKFDPTREVTAEAEEQLLRAAMCAPSAMNKQPWHFIVVRDEAKLKALAEALPYSRVGEGARLAIVVCGDLDNGLPERAKEYWIQDCSAATENLLLAAKGLGLGAVWTGVYPGEDRVASVRQILSIPEGFMPLNVIPVGYPAENPPPKDKWNPEKIHRDRF